MHREWRSLVDRAFRKRTAAKETKGKGHVHGSSDQHGVRLGRQMVAIVRRQRHRQKHSRHAASAQYRAGRRDRQARQLRRAHLEQSDQIQIRRRPLSAQQQARNHLGRALLQGFRQPAGQARSRAGAGAGAFCGSGGPGRRRGRRPFGDDRDLRLQRIAGRSRARGSPSNCNRRSAKPGLPSPARIASAT